MTCVSETTTLSLMIVRISILFGCWIMCRPYEIIRQAFKENFILNLSISDLTIRYLEDIDRITMTTNIRIRSRSLFAG